MESNISIPISILRKWSSNRNNNNIKENKDDDMNKDVNDSNENKERKASLVMSIDNPRTVTSTSTGGCFESEPILLYFQDDDPSLLFVISDTIIPLFDEDIICIQPRDAADYLKSPAPLPPVQLHPLLQEFMIVSASNIALRVHGNQEQHTNNNKFTFSSSSANPNNDSVPVSLQYIHPPNFYYYNNDYCFINKDRDDDHDDDDLLNCTISRQMFHLQRIEFSSIYDLTHADIDIEITLEYIYCSDQQYEQYFIQMGKIMNNNEHNNNQWHLNENHEHIMFQYLNQILCQAFEYKVVKQSMIVPIRLPPFPQHHHHYTNTHDMFHNFFLDIEHKGYSNNNCDDRDYDEEGTVIVAFFKLQKLNVQQPQLQKYEGSGEESKYHFYRIGSVLSKHHEHQLYENNYVGNDERYKEMNINYLSIQIALPPCHANKSDVTCNDTIDTSPNHSAASPGYETLVDDIISMANIQIESGAPTAILLTGCSGVGKSTLALTVVKKLQSDGSYNNNINIISAKDLILQASSSIIDIHSLKKMILQPKDKSFTTINSIQSIHHQRRVLIIDDLDVLFQNTTDNNNSDESRALVVLSNERKVALYAVLESIDEIVQKELKKYKDNMNNNPIPFILGICRCEPKKVPSIINRVGRFEKIITMLPPSEIQRQQMLKSMIYQLPILIGNNRDIDDIVHRWSVVLARTTAGYVASDLNRICIDALTRSQARNLVNIPIIKNNDNCYGDDDDEADTSSSSSCYRRRKSDEDGVIWEDLREATRSCIPSQLVDLDVTIPRDEIDDKMIMNQQTGIDKRGTKEWFEECWKSFGGYSEMKSDLYRTVFRPWCRRHNFDAHVSGGRLMSKLEQDVPPPTGILFHGVSGTGKTFAVDCLSRALGLNIIRIRASDILDKWLGGSEALLRMIFSRSRAAAPCLLLFDELDALANNREDSFDDDGSGGSSSDLYSRLLSTLLNEMDGVNNTGSGNSNGNRNDILIVGTTNRIHAIDAALLRPGRFEKHILMCKPSINDINEMLKLYLRKAPLHDDIDLMDVAELLHELDASGADIKGICTESCLIAIREVGERKNSDNYDDGNNYSGITTNHCCVQMKDIEEAIRLWKN